MPKAILYLLQGDYRPVIKNMSRNSQGLYDNKN